MQTSEQINELAAALAQAQAVMEGATKDRANPHFRSQYATLASVWDAARGPLTAHGLAVVQTARADGPTVTVETLLTHRSGQWIRDALTLTARDAGPQAIGSCITYGRRYALAAVAGIAPEDDDAEAATARPATGYTHRAEPQPVPLQGAWGSTGAPQAVPDDGQVYVAQITNRATKNPNITRYELTLSTGEVASTIKQQLAAIAERAVNERLPVQIETRETKFGVELVSLRLDEGGTAPAPAVMVDADQIPF